MRAILIVLDSVGIGELPDAADFHDTGTNTLVHIKQQIPEMDLKNMNAIGLSSIDGAESLADVKVTEPTGAFCKLCEASKGKDTTIGHWEIAGLVIKKPMPTYPDGFPKEIIEEFVKQTGREILGNCVASGTAILDELGDEHVRTGKPIVYTSADSVFQIAANEDVIPVSELYNMCEIARKILVGENAVSRVIARPFVGTSGAYSRTRNRKDFSLLPPGKTMLDFIKEDGLSVAAVGKIEDIFARQGITESVHIENNMDGVDKTLEFTNTVENGLIFTNLVDFDMLFGHRNNVRGYADALIDFDKRLPEIISKLKEEDILFITADHGCDPTTPGTDHTREHIPLLIYGQNAKHGVNLGVRESFADIAATILEYLHVNGGENGKSFLKDIIN